MTVLCDTPSFIAFVLFSELQSEKLIASFKLYFS